MADFDPEYLERLMAHHRPPVLPHGPFEEQVFDPFVFEGREQYFHYLGDALLWMVRPTLDLAQRAPTVELEGDAAEAYNALRFMPPPLPHTDPLPASPYDHVGSAIFQGPIWYRGQQFIWFFTSENGWELAKHSKPEESSHVAE